MSRDLEIDRVEVLVVGPPTERHAWALGMDEQFMSHTILRLFTRGGLEGVAGAAAFSAGAFDLSVAETLRTMVPALLGRRVSGPEAIGPALNGLTLPRAPQAASLIDVAVWDALAKAADLPLRQLLGGARDSIPSYASTPLLPSVDAYLDLVAELSTQGFGAVKFHCWCEPVRDMALCQAVRARHGDVALMLDVEQRYDRQAARRVGRLLDELAFRWFEAPLDDFDTGGYRELTARLATPILPAGNSITDPRQIARGLAEGCWSAVRVDVMSCGGLTPARKVVALAEAFGTTVELQCWGYTLHQAANLHLMLASPNAGYFEQPFPYPAFEHGCLNPIRTQADGRVRAPDAGPGLGVALDWPALEAATLVRFEV